MAALIAPGLLEGSLYAQQGKDTPVIQVRNNIILLSLSKSTSPEELIAFTHRYNLKDIGLYQLINRGKNDSLKQSGWETIQSDSKYTVSKKLTSGGKFINPSDKMIFYAIPTPDNWRVQGGNRVVYGMNDLKKDGGPVRHQDFVEFRLKGFSRAQRVRLAGNFSNWQHGAFPMERDGDDWVVRVSLKPGAWYYKYILNESDWITDPENNLEESDGRGNINSVFYVTNKSIKLKGYTNADEVFISGTFNNWVKDQLPMRRRKDGWELDLFLEPGTHRYQYIINGKALEFEKPPRETAEIGAPHIFKLNGFKNAKSVILTGNFNDWNPDQLWMKPTAEGWELAYVLGPGNYLYNFIVDGKWIADPKATGSVNDNKGKSPQNSFLVVQPNHRFTLPGFSKAKNVFLAGDFNDWNPEVLPMKKIEGGWSAEVFLGRGKHKYKFIVDGKWITDPSNELVEDNEFNSGNSIIWIE
ncbi:hypothetical protein [Pollutibacter soli]|uniref:hypothetical protein n=1 Tax=Pollutibacter soli TaxID=3034157 RepID=UPI003014158D